jgi:shikimate kinase
VRERRDLHGVGVIHPLEARQLLDALAATDPSVISAAASTVEVPECRAAMTAPDLAVVWLHALPETLARRLKVRDQHRPEYGGSPEVFLAEQAARRNSLFASLDPVVVDTDRIRPGEAVSRVLEALSYPVDYAG